MKVAIYTLPFTWNYGGILQSFALEMMLEEMGHDVEIICRRKDSGMVCNILKRVKWGTIRFCQALQIHTDDPLVATESFKQGHIKQSSLIFTTESLRRYCEERGFNAVVVGSDQIWRYSAAQDIYNSFCDFVQDDVTKIAYAVSFGVSEWKYPPMVESRCRELLKSFKAVSVRERSAIELCQKHLGVKPSLALDPTLLAGRDLFDKVKSSVGEHGRVFTYFLDPSLDKSRIASVVSERLRCDTLPFMESEIKRTVENWIAGISGSCFVVTDSFHGMCFSIIYKKPFIVVGNAKRGMARFTSLASLLGVSERVIDSTACDADVASLIFKDPKWIEIDNRLFKERANSYVFLKNSLCGC